MHMASFLPAARRRAPVARRTLVFAAVLAVHLLLALILLLLTPDAPPAPPPAATVVRLLPQPAAKPSPPRVKQTEGAKRSRATPTPPRPKPVPPPPPPKPAETPLGTVLFDAFDITSVPSVPRDSAAASADAAGTSGIGPDSATVAGPGAGPDGQPLYAAEWYREPTNAEIAGYLKQGAPQGSWAIVACKTIEKFHVEDCRELGESPIGSGLSRSLRQAAWQFRVRPPRVGGRALVGAWVRIRIDFSQGQAD